MNITKPLRKRRTRHKRSLKRGTVRHRKQRRSLHNYSKKGGAVVYYSSNDLADAINYIRTNAMHLDYEICGTISVQDDVVHVIMHEIPSSTVGKRKMCMNEYYDSIIWHTHPASSKFYPSLEDVEKIIKTKNEMIKRSFIITNFGVWQLRSIRHTNITTSMRKNIQFLLDKLYYNTGRGRQYDKYSVTEFTTRFNRLLRGIMFIKFHTM